MPERKNRKATTAKSTKSAPPKKKPSQKKRKYKARVTQKQRRLLELIRENTVSKENKSLGELMVEAGYSPSTARTPSDITQGKSWQEVMEEKLPDSKISEVHSQLLSASKLDHYIFPKGESDKEIKEVVESVPGCKLVKIKLNGAWKRAYFWSPDNRSRKDAVEMAYKLKSKYAAQKVEVTLFDKYREQPDEELEKVINDDDNEA